MSDTVLQRVQVLRGRYQLPPAEMDQVVKAVVSSGAVHWSVVWDAAIAPLLQSGLFLPQTLDLAATGVHMSAAKERASRNHTAVAEKQTSPLRADLVSVVCTFLSEKDIARAEGVAYEWFSGARKPQAVSEVVTRGAFGGARTAPYLGKRAFGRGVLQLRRLVLGYERDPSGASAPDPFAVPPHPSPLSRIERTLVSRVASVRALHLSVQLPSPAPVFDPGALAQLHTLEFGPRLGGQCVRTWCLSLGSLTGVEVVSLTWVRTLDEDVLGALVTTSWQAKVVTFEHCMFVDDLTASVVSSSSLAEGADECGDAPEARAITSWVNADRLVLRRCWLNWSFLDAVFRCGVFETVRIDGGRVWVPKEQQPTWVGHVRTLSLSCVSGRHAGCVAGVWRLADPHAGPTAWDDGWSRLSVHVRAEHVLMDLPARGMSDRRLRQLFVDLHFCHEDVRRWTLVVAEPMDRFGESLVKALPRPLLGVGTKLDEVELRFVGPVYPSALRAASLAWVPTWLRHARDHARRVAIAFCGAAAEHVSVKWARGRLPHLRRRLGDFVRGAPTCDTWTHAGRTTLRGDL